MDVWIERSLTGKCGEGVHFVREISASIEIDYEGHSGLTDSMAP